MCTPADAAANGKRIGSIGDGHLENREVQGGPFGGLLAFLPILRLVGRMKTLHCCLMAFDVPCPTNGELMHSRGHYVYAGARRSKWTMSWIHWGQARGELGDTSSTRWVVIGLFYPYCT